MPVDIRQVSANDDLPAICAQMQPDGWATDNEMTSYELDKLKLFLNAGGLLLLAWQDNRIAGAALGYVMPHPSGEDALYVHELDTHPDFRRHGIAKALMQEVFRMAKERGLSEVWLGADTDNDGANALYKSLSPTEIEPANYYSYGV